MKKLSLLSIACFITCCVFSQTFMHGAGVGTNITRTRGSFSEAFATFLYSPRVNVSETESMSVSVGVPLTFGFSGSYNYSSNNGQSGSLSFMFNAPVMINLNMGRGATKEENERRFGYFFGAGFGYHYVSTTKIVEDSYYGDYNNTGELNAYGPAANAGMRFGVGNRHKNIEVLFSYMKGIDDSKANVFGISGLFNF